MRLYHGSFAKVRKPKLELSRKNLDFGRGFYCTTLQKQAEAWAINKAHDFRTNPVVSVYEFHDNDQLIHKHFRGYSEEWLMFIVMNRREDKESPAPLYDVITGNIADDVLFQQVQDFVARLTENRLTEAYIKATLEQLTYQKVNDQYCLTSDKALSVLEFIESYEVK
jgi:hypothetical protein